MQIQPEPVADAPLPAGQALRTLLIFQLKLLADAARDLLLSPVSVVLMVLDLVQRNPAQDSHYARLMALGRRSDHFINLFDHVDEPDTTIDAVVGRAEQMIRKPPSES